MTKKKKVIEPSEAKRVYETRDGTLTLYMWSQKEVRLVMQRRIKGKSAFVLRLRERVQ
jgi:hypothetical protein